MTIDISTMPAGAEMDRLVAEKVMGWSKTPEEGVYRDHDAELRRAFGIEHIHQPFHPSTNIAHALEALEAWRKQGGPVRGGCGREFSMGYAKEYDRKPFRYDPYWCELNDSGSSSGVVSADTLPLAISRAALMCVGDK